MPPKQKGTGAKGPSKSAKQVKPDQSNFLDQAFKEEYERRGVFIEKLIERLTQYGEDGPKLLDAYKDETDLPQPKLKTEAITESQTKTYDKEIQSLTKRNQELFKKLEQQKRQLRSGKAVPQNDSESDTATLKGNLHAIKEALETISDELEDQKQANALLQKQHEDLKAKCKKYDTEIQSLTKRVQELLKELEQHKRRLRSGKAVPRNDSENDTETLMANLQASKDALKTTSDELEDQKQANALLQKQQEDLKAKCRKLEDQVEAMGAPRKENEDVKANVLSLVEGARLTDSSPEIRDLSDPIRPLSLAEKFSELYDNEWTDAMEEIAEKMLEETKAIKLLLDIVCDAYKFCLYRSDKIMDTINSTLDGFLKEFGLSQVKTMEVSKTNKDYRKQLAVHVVKYIEQDFAKEMKIKMKTKVGASTEAYMKRCVSVCWFMTVHDPKVVMTTKQPELFDEDLYRPYTKKGKRMDYLVWPALYLHEGGPLIGKGVAQGK